jgi:glycosyltransferase involved in cell wall biosynthesis
LAEAIQKGLSDDDLLKRMGRNGCALVKRHDWSIVAKQTEELYKRALTAR